MTVGRLLREISSIEIAEWIAEDRIRVEEQNAKDAAAARAKLHPQHRGLY